MPRLVSNNIQVHNTELLQDIFAQHEEGNGNSRGASHGVAQRRQQQQQQHLSQPRPQPVRSGSSRSSEAASRDQSTPRQKVKISQKYVPAYARTQVADRKTRPHPQTRKLPDAEKEARRQARKKLTQSQIESQHQRRLKLAAEQVRTASPRWVPITVTL